jgi:hypothetical protein
VRQCDCDCSTAVQRLKKGFKKNVKKRLKILAKRAADEAAGAAPCLVCIHIIDGGVGRSAASGGGGGSEPT